MGVWAAKPEQSVNRSIGASNKAAGKILWKQGIMRDVQELLKITNKMEGGGAVSAARTDPSGSTETFESLLVAAPHCCKAFKCFDKLIHNQKG